MEGWSLLLQKSPCLMEGGMDGWMDGEGVSKGKKEGSEKRKKLGNLRK